jgi:dienelactone hydrolase
VAVCPVRAAEEATALPGTQPLTLTGDLSAQMVAGIDQFLVRETEKAAAERSQLWRRDFVSREAYEKSVSENREHLRRMIGAVDPRVPPALEVITTLEGPPSEAQSETCSAAVVRWPVFEGVFGEGLLLRPKSTPTALVVAVPDADQTPEMVAGLQPGLAAERQFARRLVENGCLVLVPALVDRRDTYSGNPRLNRFTNQPHREWIYRPSFEMGRHIIGYEVQKVLAAVDWLEAQRSGQRMGLANQKIGVMGHGEGGLIAFYSAALDGRVAATLVSGYFDSRQRLWEEPIYRNVFGLLREFGDAEIASLIAPRRLVVEHSEPVKVDGPPSRREGRSGAAPGRIVAPDFLSVESEVNRANELTRALKDRPPIEFVYGAEGMVVPAGSEKALLALLDGLGVSLRQLGPSQRVPALQVSSEQAEARQKRQVDELVQFTQRLFRESERVRDGLVWSHLKGPADESWTTLCQTNRARFWDEVIGRFPKASQPLEPRSRKLYDKPKWTGYEVVLNVWPDVFAWGYLLVPKDLQAGERRPVVVCQHGLEGVPADVVTDDPKSGAFGYYQAYAAQLAERGFVVYAPHNPYRGQDKFRVLQRKANPLGKSLFSVIIAQHDATLDWLTTLPFVDPARIGFYGLSYGGKTAMRVPAVLDRYCLSICSADFNEWVQKNVTVDSGYSYVFTGEYEMVEWDLGHTFNYAEMASLIAPRPFMVERGHFDGVAPDTWVAYEYAKIRRMYSILGLPERTAIEFFNGPHRIHGVGTFQFLHRHLNWPEPK